MRNLKIATRLGTFLAIICVIGGVITFSSCREFWEEEVFYHVEGMKYRRWHSQGQVYFTSAEVIGSDLVKDVHFILREIDGTPVIKMGVVPFMSSDAEPVCIEYYNNRVYNVYCPGSIEQCNKNYFRPYYIDEADVSMRIFYCGEVIELSNAGYGKNLVYYVPSEQIEDYRLLWQEGYAGEIRAANVEYHLNAEDMEKFYYVDYVETGANIKNVPPEPTRNGYIFGGWYLDENGTKAWDFNNSVDVVGGNLKLYAKW